MATYNISYTAEQVQAAIGKKPIIQNRHWFVWNVSTMQYEDTGVVAEGSDGSATDAAESAALAEHWAEVAQKTSTASGISYDNTASGLSATDVQSAVDELTAKKAENVTATQSSAGLMSATDKSKLDGISSGATANTPYTSTPAMDGTGNSGSSTAFARGDHVHPSDSAKLNIHGKGVNLLDNWYFIGGGSQQGGGQFPINQRGSISYATGYTIDRWKSLAATTTVALTSESIRLRDSGANWLFMQEMKSVLVPGNTYTLSVLYKAENSRIRLVASWGTGQYFYNTSSPVSSTYQLATITGTIPEDASIANEQVIVQSLDANGIIDLQAIKLELGDTQTLARQENGQWVLNDPPPNYALELAKCNMSLAQANDSYSNFPFLHIVSGSYVGTGTYGSSNPNSLSFSFAPKIIWCSSDMSYFSGESTSTQIVHTLYTPLISTDYKNNCGFSERGGSYTFGKKSSDGKTFWWYTNSTYGAIAQNNLSGTTYYYTAIG